MEVNRLILMGVKYESLALKSGWFKNNKNCFVHNLFDVIKLFLLVTSPLSNKQPQSEIPPLPIPVFTQ